MSDFRFFSYDRLGKILLYVLTDIIFVVFSLSMGISLFYEGALSSRHQFSAIPHNTWIWFQYVSVFASLFSVFVYSAFKMYNNLWKYASIDEFLKIFVATIAIFLGIFLFDLLVLERLHLFVLPRRLIFVAWAINTLLFTFSRFGYRAARRMFLFFSHIVSSKAGMKRVMIIGAGFAGYGVIRGMKSTKIRDKFPVIVLDDDRSKNNTTILGVRVIAGLDKIVELVSKFQIDEITIALSDPSNAQLQKIISQCTQTDCTLKIIPPMSDVTEGAMRTLRDVNISDLLLRDEITLDTKNISEYLSSRIVLVTGGGGSIGSELCRQISKFAPRKIVIFDVYENSAFGLANELNAKYKGSVEIVLRIGSVCDTKRVESIFEEFKPHVVFHTAAYKHVSLMEESPCEAVKNNIYGTQNVVNSANDNGTERFVLISTDKAVNPTNVYGATKRVTELIMQEMSQKSKTKYMAVRFGNVLGSNGSVVPIFKSQIKSGGPVTVTHPDMERYFMTIPEACQLVLQASSLNKTGRIFVLDMGDPVKINDLAKNLIKLSGYRPGKDIEIVYTGLRAGEKLYEELILEEEKEESKVTCHKKILMTKPVEMDYKKFEDQLEILLTMVNKEPDKVVDYLKVIVPNFKEVE